MPSTQPLRLVSLLTVARLLVSAFALCTTPTLADDLTSDSRSLPPFHAVEVSGSLDVRWAPGNSETAVVKAREDFLPRIHTEVRDGRLFIYCSGSFSDTSGMSVTLTGHHLDGIALKGSGDLAATKISEPKLKVDLAGSGDLVLTGEVDDLTASLAGSGDLTADHLQSRTATISVAGSGDVRIRASQRLNASIAGSGTITYSGDPGSVSRSVFGSGEITAAR